MNSVYNIHVNLSILKLMNILENIVNIDNKLEVLENETT